MSWQAREWMSPAVVTYFIRELTENSANNEELLDNLDWYILPVANPDGYTYTQFRRFWRKNRYTILTNNLHIKMPVVMLFKVSKQGIFVHWH